MTDANVVNGSLLVFMHAYQYGYICVSVQRARGEQWPTVVTLQMSEVQIQCRFE